MLLKSVKISWIISVAKRLESIELQSDPNNGCMKLSLHLKKTKQKKKPCAKQDSFSFSSSNDTITSKNEILHAFISSTADYCNSLYSPISQKDLQHLQFAGS